MTVGPLIVAVGLVLLAGIGPGTTYLTGVLPGLVVFGLGLSLTVAPLTAAVMGSVEEHHVGVGSGVNNAVARVAGLLAVAVLPSLAGLETASAGVQFTDGVSRAPLHLGRPRRARCDQLLDHDQEGGARRDAAAVALGLVPGPVRATATGGGRRGRLTGAC